MKNKKRRDPREIKNGSINNSAGKSDGILKKLGILLLNFALLYAILRLIIELSERWENPLIYQIGSVLYALAGSAAFVAFYVLNGFWFEKRERNYDELPDKWSDEKKSEFLRKQPENKRRARQLIYIILPIVITLIISYIELMILK